MKTICLFPRRKITQYAGAPTKNQGLLCFGNFNHIHPVWEKFLDQKYNAADVILEDGNRKIVRIESFGESFVAKSYSLSTIETIYQCLGVHRKNRGLGLGNGEALNTYIANCRGAPSHELVAYISILKFGSFPSKQVLFFRDLSEYEGLDSLAKSPRFRKRFSIIGIIVETLYSINQKGLYHGDANISNILFSEQEKMARLIDFELSSIYRCSPAIALMLQFTCTWDWRLDPIIHYEAYKAACIDQLKIMVEDNETLTNLEKIFSLFTSKKMSSGDRENRLRAVASSDDTFLFRTYL